MRRLVVVFAGALAACGSGDDAPNVDSIDVLVSGSDVHAWVHFTDAEADMPRLAAPGECAGASTDVAPPTPSCLDHLAVDGVTLSGNGGTGFFNPLSASMTLASTSTLHAVGCGESIDIPLDLAHAPHVTDVTATASGDDEVVTWTRSDAASVLVGYYGETGSYYCNEPTATTKTIEGGARVFPEESPFIEVRGISEAQTTETALGPIRIYYGDLTHIALPVTQE